MLYILYICKSCETCWFLSFTGDLQSTVLAMSDSACEASVALGAYARVSNRHSTLTSECGSMLEEVRVKILMLIDYGGWSVVYIL